MTATPLQSLCCYGTQLCTIPKDGNYYYWENRCLADVIIAHVIKVRYALSHQGHRAEPVLWRIHTLREVHGQHGRGGAHWRGSKSTKDVRICRHTRKHLIESTCKCSGGFVNKISNWPSTTEWRTRRWWSARTVGGSTTKSVFFTTQVFLDTSSVALTASQ